MSLRHTLLVVLLQMSATGSSLAEGCRQPGEPARNGSLLPPCRPAERLQPYEPDRVRAGRTSGSIDLGNGAEVRIGGSVRFEGDLRRR